MLLNPEPMKPVPICTGAVVTLLAEVVLVTELVEDDDNVEIGAYEVVVPTVTELFELIVLEIYVGVDVVVV